jgi:hypothetical protein
MAATIEVSCPKCKKALNLPAELKGKKIRCKECGTIFPVGTSAPAPAAKAAGKPASEEDNEPASYGFVEEPKPETKAKADARIKSAAPPPKQGVFGAANPYGVTESDLTARCPHCAKEMDSEDAIICLHCGYNTRTREKPQVKVVFEITPMDRFWWLLPGIINVFLIFFVIWLAYFFCYGLDDTWQAMDDFTDTPTLSRGLRVWFVFGSLFAIYKCTRYAIKRLILQPTPPEEEKK